MIGGVVLYGRLSARDEAVTATRAALGDAAFDAGYRHGRQLPFDEAINYALERDPPPTGGRPDAADHGPRLTPREAEVAEPAAGGLTNRQIATMAAWVMTRTARGRPRAGPTSTCTPTWATASSARRDWSRRRSAGD
jgi:hypothetical protein